MKALLLFILLSITMAYPIITINTWYMEHGSRYVFITPSFDNVTISLAIYGNVTNLGDKPIPINDTDILVFEYPLKMPDQHIYRVKAWVNGVNYNYSLCKTNFSTYLIIESPYYNETLKPGDTISVGVEYLVGINMTRRQEPVLDFMKTNDPYTLLSKAEDWDQLKPYINETTTGATSLWNYSHPLVKLLNKYLERMITSNKPLGYLLGVLGWFDDSIVYSTRIPPRFPWEVIIEGAGDCDDQSNLLITLLRLKKIPSYLETGMVYISESYRYEDTGAGGYYYYRFIGGGGHGWVVAYIPPWGWIRIDPIVRSDLFTGRKAPLYKVAIKYALFYWFPTIVTERIFKKDYVTQSAKATEEIQVLKIKFDIVVEMHMWTKT